MTWLLIIVVLAAAFAPVAYMMPSKRDRRLAELRMIARREGLEVDVTRLPKLAAEAHERVSASGVAREAHIECVSYGLRRRRTDAQVVRYRLLQHANTEFPVAPGEPWELDRGFSPATSPAPPPEYYAILAAIRDSLPQDVLGLAVTDEFVLCYWREKLPGEAAEDAALVAGLRQALNKIANHHEAFFAPPPAPES